eukprot:1665068-Prymnesium_polylepis.1
MLFFVRLLAAPLASATLLVVGDSHAQVRGSASTPRAARSTPAHPTRVCPPAAATVFGQFARDL